MNIGRMHHAVPICVFIAFLWSCAAATAAVVRVKPGGNDAGSGADWASAKATVSGAIAAANQGDEIWVAAGTYEENIANRVVEDRAVDVAVYGGFAGDESVLTQRDPEAHPTILDGMGNGPVVRITHNAGPGTRIDGFTIRNGTAGIHLLGSAAVIANNTIRNNEGPGVYMVNYQILGISPPSVAFPEITRNTIVENTAGNGAGIAVVGAEEINFLPSSAPKITHNIIVRNTAAQNGGGIGSWGHASPFIANNYIGANTATAFEIGWDGDSSVGSWLVGGGGIFATKNDMGGQPIQFAISAPTIVNNMVAANGAWLGGGISLVAYPYQPEIPPDKNPPPVVTNNTVVGNNGAGIYWQNNFPVVRNNLVTANTWGLEQDGVTLSYPTVESNDIFGNVLQGEPSDYKGMADQTGTNGNLSVDPRLANRHIGEFHLQPGSPCIDAGSDAAVEAGWTDYDGQSRIIGAGVDIGADESDGSTWTASASVFYARPGGNDSLDGLTWATAKRTLGAAISAAAAGGGEVWAAAGTYAERIGIPAFVHMYGGFAGGETNRGLRNASANPTIIDGGGIPTVVQSTHAGYLVSTLDGFTIQNGGVFTEGAIPGALDGFEGRGGGIRSAVTSLYILGNIIQRNSLGNPFDNANKRAHGGGIHGYLSYSVISGNLLADNEILNTIDGVGGAMYFKLSMPFIEGNEIVRNHAKYGSAIYCTLSSPRISRNAVYDNWMYDTYPLPLYLGGAEGAIALDMGDGFLIEGNLVYANVAGVGAGINVKTNLGGRIENNVIAYNTALDPTSSGGMGGGIYALAPLNATGPLFILNNTILGNTGSAYLGEQGGGIALSIPPQISGPEPIPERVVIGNNIIAFNSSGFFETLTTPMVPPVLASNALFNTGADYINVPQGATDIDEDPLFLDLEEGDLRLSPDSSCIDAGDNSFVSLLHQIDYWGNPRLSDGNRDGAAVIDMGAFELYIANPGAIDMDGDRKSDLTVLRQSLGTWYSLPSASPGAYTSTQWGAPGDLPVAGDYDGDGRMDIAVWRPSNGIWYLMPSGAPGTYVNDQWGVGTDRPLPGDYDGDGVTDMAVWRPALGIWYIMPSGAPGTYIVKQWGIPSDVPVPADYDADGKTDIAVWRPDSGVWFVLPSGSPGPGIVRQWGDSSDIPVPADYDADGRADIAVWRAGNGVWFILPSQSPGTYDIREWGTVSDIPVPADYDGDSRADVAVWRPGSGVWFIWLAGAPGSYAVTQWGASGDCPISPITRILN